MFDKTAKVLPLIRTFRSDKIYGITTAVQGDDVAYSEHDHRGSVNAFGALRSTAERTDDDDKDKGNIELEDDIEDDWTDSIGSHPRERPG